MDAIKKLDSLVLKSTSDSSDEISDNLLNEILELVNSRVDMPKHLVASISKRMAFKNKKVLTKIFTIIEFLVYQCELSLYSQISTKEFLFKISGLLMNKEIEPEVKTKIMESIYCCEELFRPHEDLLPMFFQFYAGLLRNGYDIPHDYKSVFRPAQLKQYKIPETVGSKAKPTEKPSQSSKQRQAPSLSEQKTFEEIREKLILTNEIIDNSNPSENVKENGLLLEMIEQVKECEKNVNKTINENPNENIMEIALAANDDIFITYRRFKDLQRNKKPEPFILTELASDISKEKEHKKTVSQIQKPVVSSKPQIPKNEVNILDFDEPQKPQVLQPEKKEEDLFDLVNYQEPQNSQPQPQPQPQGNIFDLLGESSSPSTFPQPQQQPPNSSMTFDLLQQQSQPKPPVLGGFEDLLISTQNYQGMPMPSGFGISLNANDFQTEADLKSYNNKSAIDKLEDMTYEFLKK